MNPSVAIEQITPERAEELLRLNTANRPKSHSKCNYLAAKMTLGRWLFTGQAHVIIGSNGVLLNGQHTLTAVVISGVTITTVVSRGVDPEAFAAIDIGMKRTAGHVFGVAGVQHGQDVAAVIRKVTTFDSVERKSDGSWVVRSSAIDNDEVLDVYGVDPVEWEAAVSTARATHSRARTSGLTLQKSVVGAFLHMACRAGHNPLDVQDFVFLVASDEGHHTGLPATSLRRWLTANAGNNGLNYDLASFSAWVKAWNATIDGQPLSKIYAFSRASAEFPVITSTAVTVEQSA